MPCAIFRSALARTLAPLVLACAFASAPANAAGTLADITVIDRSSGRVLPTYVHQGRHFVAGTPGTRYAVRVASRSAERIMSVVAVDGVNVVTGEAASWEQNGYVLAAWQRHDIAGWRKTQAEVAAFEFTALPNSYAARTGRPDHVGVIGVAVFREYRVPALQPTPRPSSAGRVSRDAPSEEIAHASSDSGEGRALSKPAPESKLGTGHGAREPSWVNYTAFQRAQATPDEIITLFYDSRENLMAQGVIPSPRLRPSPNPFPGQPQVGFVPDPPRHW